MKRIIISLISILLLVFSSCYDDSNKATVRINLGNMPIAKQVENKSFIDKVFSIFVKDAYAQTVPDAPYFVRNIYLAAYREGTLIAKEKMDTTGMDAANNVVEFKVPAGDNITILVVGESSYEGQDSKPVYYAKYYGYNSADLKAGSTSIISVQMFQASWTFDGNYNNMELRLDCGNIITWSPAGVKVKYYIQDLDLGTLIYEGYDVKPIQGYGQSSLFNFTVEFEDFNLKTIPDTVDSGC